MDPIPNQTSPGPSEGDATIPGELVTISRSELDDLLAQISISNSTRNPPDPSRAIEPSSDHPLDLLEEPKKSPAGREAPVVRELSERVSRVAELERICKDAVRERELATILAGKPLVAGAAAQLIKLWRDDFDAYEEDGVYKVTARDGRSVSQVVVEMLASPEYSHFSLASSRGGSGARGASRPVDSVANPAGPKNLGEAIVMKWREESATHPENLHKPIGLRRHR